MTADELIAALRDPPPPPTEAEVAAFEAKLGHALPADYRAFLLKCNGGAVDGYTNYADGACVAFIGGLSDSDSSLHKGLEYAAESLPEGTMWIMDDPFGNAVLLGLVDDMRGKVYFWDHEMQPDPETWDRSFDTADNFSLICESFDEFLAGLAHEPPDTRAFIIRDAILVVVILIAMVVIGRGLDEYTDMPTWACYLLGVPLGVPGGFCGVLFVQATFDMVTSIVDPEDSLLANVGAIINASAFIALCTWPLQAWTPLPLWACIIIATPIGIIVGSIAMLFGTLFTDLFGLWRRSRKSARPDE